MLDCNILGPVEFGAAGRAYPLGATKTAHFLAALAVDAGRPVSMDTLVNRLWDEEPLGNPLSSLYSNATRLRKKIAEVRELAGDQRAPRVLRDSSSYRLDVDPDRVDWLRFGHLADRARSLSTGTDDIRALDLLREAEGLWRGDPLAGLKGAWARTTRTALSQKRLAATLLRISIELRMGHFAEIIAELTTLVDQHPSDEVLIGDLMIASYGRGLHADALRLYEELRRRLRTELGSQPGPELSRLHRLMLTNAPVTALIHRDRSDRPRRTPPRNFPLHAELVGRRTEVATLLSRLDSSASSGAVVALQSISGMAGIGKSLLALHVAELLEERFPEGQIHLDLRGHAPTQDPLRPEEALVQLLQTLGVAPGNIPERVEELSAMWRALLGNRRLALVLDDAAGSEQLRPLLPRHSPSLVLITSRRRLTGLPGVRQLFLDLLPASDAIALFRRLVDDDRADDEREVARIVELCDCLPLAVEIAASRLNSRPSWSLSHLISRLTQGHGRIGELHDNDRDIGRVFYVSYATLTTEEQGAFRLLSLHLAPEFGTHSAAAVIGVSPERAERVIDALLDSHLLQEPAPERYRFHDLVGEFALDLENNEDSAAHRDRAVGRLISFYIRAADAADRLLHPAHCRFETTPASPAPGELPMWRTPKEAEDWLMAERAGLIRATHHARTHGDPEAAAILGSALAGFLEAGGFWTDAVRVHLHAAHHWQRVGNGSAEARARIDLSIVYAKSSRYEKALEAVERALSVARDVHDHDAGTEALHQRATMYWYLGRLDEALSTGETVLRLRRLDGDRRQIARALNNQGIFQRYRGDYETAMRSFEEALSMFRELGDLPFERRVLNNLGDVYIRTGRRTDARRTLEKCVAMEFPKFFRSDQAAIEITLASTLDIPDQLDDALEIYRNAMQTFEDLGDIRNVISCANGLGEAFRRAGRPDEAVTHHVDALARAREIGAAIEESQSLRLLGMAEYRLGRLRPAIDHLEAARALARDIDSPGEAAQATDALADALRAAGEAERAPNPPEA